MWKISDKGEERGFLHPIRQRGAVRLAKSCRIVIFWGGGVCLITRASLYFELLATSAPKGEEGLLTVDMRRRLSRTTNGRTKGDSRRLRENKAGNKA